MNGWSGFAGPAIDFVYTGHQREQEHYDGGAFSLGGWQSFGVERDIQLMIHGPRIVERKEAP
jgi:hypothetical protein